MNLLLCKVSTLHSAELLHCVESETYLCCTCLLVGYVSSIFSFVKLA